jgi:hypothetical protein
VAASASLLLTNDFSSQSFLLNGMAISFVSHVDDMVALFVVPQPLRERTHDAIEAAIAGGFGERLRTRRFASNRLRGIVWAAALVGIIACCERLIDFLPGHGLPGQTSCDNVLTVCLVVPMFLGLLIFVVETTLSGRRHGCWIAVEVILNLQAVVAMALFVILCHDTTTGATILGGGITVLGVAVAFTGNI